MSKYVPLLILSVITIVLLILPASAAINQIAHGGDVFIGEEGLDVTTAVNVSTKVAWFASGTNPTTDTPNYIVAVDTPTSFYVAPADFVGRTGNWYRWNGANQGVAFNVVDPRIDIKVWDQNSNKDATGMQVPEGNMLNFRVETNTYSVVNRPGYAGEGFVKIKVKNPDGATYTSLYQSATTAIPLTTQAVSSSLWYWVVPHGDVTKGWNTAVTTDDGTRLYSAGTYTVSAELNPLNKIKDNYKAPDGTDYTGKSVTALKTIAITEDMLEIEASKNTVVRGNPFSVTITGRANEYYYVWMKGTSSMSGGDQDQPPMISPHQDSVANDPVEGPYAIGSYSYEGGAGQPIKEDVPSAPNNGVYYYAKIKASTSGTCTVGFLTGPNTDAKTYTIHVENKFGDQYKSDEVDVKVETGIPVPPASVTNLHNTTYQQTSITWAWTDPSSTDFDRVMIYLNGVFTTNVTKGNQTYTATGLSPSTAYTIGTRTVGATGLINSTWVNSTATTAPDSDSNILLPVANFTANTTTGNAPFRVQFNDTSTGNVTTHAWDFNNDGSVDSSEKNPAFTYTNPGMYTVTLTVIGPGGSDNEVKTDYVTVKADPRGRLRSSVRPYGIRNSPDYQDGIRDSPGYSGGIRDSPDYPDGNPNPSHTYEGVYVPGGITWDEANADAIAKGGHLAVNNN